MSLGVLPLSLFVCFPRRVCFVCGAPLPAIVNASLRLAFMLLSPALSSVLTHTLAHTCPKAHACARHLALYVIQTSLFSVPVHFDPRPMTDRPRSLFGLRRGDNQPSPALFFLLSLRVSLHEIQERPLLFCPTRRTGSAPFPPRIKRGKGRVQHTVCQCGVRGVESTHNANANLPPPFFFVDMDKIP